MHCWVLLYWCFVYFQFGRIKDIQIGVRVLQVTFNSNANVVLHCIIIIILFFYFFT